MASIRDAKLDTPTARIRLAVTVKPYFRLIEPGLHLGYRRLASGPGTWVARRYVGAKRYAVENLRTADGRLIAADDFGEADGVTILSFRQAQDRARRERPGEPAEHVGPYTVANAMADYIADREASGKPAADAKAHNRAFIAPDFGSVECAKLKTDRLRKWLTGLATAKPRLRTRDGQRQKFRIVADDEESARRRRATANRIFTTLRAALNRAWREGKIASDAQWRRVEPFESVDSARVRYLAIAEAKRLINATAPDFRKMVRGALVTGARYGQLARLVASDFNADNGTLMVRSRKGNGKEKIFHVVLSAEGAAYFKELCAGRAADELIFRKTNGEPWGKSQQKRLMDDSCEAAKIVPPIGYHGMRHTYASHAIMNGVPLLVVAKNLGHADTRMVEKHYGHLAPSYVADAIRAGAPVFGIKPDKKIAVLQPRH
jgi:integrase